MRLDHSEDAKMSKRGRRMSGSYICSWNQIELRTEERHVIVHDPLLPMQLCQQPSIGNLLGQIALISMALSLNDVVSSEETR